MTSHRQWPPWLPFLVVAVACLAIVALGVTWTLERAARRRDHHAPPREAAVDHCVRCHGSPQDDPGGVHSASIMGCASCHLGDKTSPVADVAHAGMEREPGALDTVSLTCGTCHPQEAHTVTTSLMATARGIVAADRWAFGELPHPRGDETMADVAAASPPTPAQSHLRRLCAGCHLGARRDNRDDAMAVGGSGCSACHVARRARPSDPHPRLDGVVPDDRCLGCHSRSARISLSYQGLAEVSGTPAEQCEAPTTLFDGRSGCRTPPDVHSLAHIRCADCHLHTELMGDGTSHSRQQDAVELECTTCHGAASPVAGSSSTWGEALDPTTRNILRLRGETRHRDAAMRTGRRGTPVWNLQADQQGQWVLFPKGGGDGWQVPPTPNDAQHSMPGHDRLTCQACHSAWVPTCPTCHTHFEPDAEQWDFGAGQVAAGRWVEANDGMGFGAPALGVRADGTIGPAAPGMIATVDARAAGGSAFALRLFSPFDPHTTSKQGRTCVSCHRSAAALGLGTGDLRLEGAHPSFAPAHPAATEDGAPAVDAWTSLFPEVAGQSTQPGARSLDAQEQWRVLRVGVCLPCHDQAADAIWADFGESLWRQAEGTTACPSRAAAWVLHPSHRHGSPPPHP